MQFTVTSGDVSLFILTLMGAYWAYGRVVDTTYHLVGRVVDRHSSHISAGILGATCMKSALDTLHTVINRVSVDKIAWSLQLVLNHFADVVSRNDRAAGEDQDGNAPANGND